MTSYLQIEGLTMRFGDLLLYEQVNLEVAEGQKVAVVARNGAGKSTLLQLIAGKETPVAGRIIRRNGLRMTLLEQQPQYEPTQTVWQTFMRLENELKQFHREEEWRYETRAKQLLSQLRVGDLEQTVGSLSGGQLKRLALAGALISEPDLLLLDEPTNHLDLEMVEWLEDYLNRSRLSLLMVTHDRYFLDRVCSDIVEISDKRFYRYKGNYSYYLEKREQRSQQQQAELDRANNLFRKELAWIRRQPQARGTKARSRVDAFYDMQEKVSQWLTEQDLRLEVQSGYIGSKIFEARYVNKVFGDRVILKDFCYNFSRYEKLGIVGKNGSGKSTFLKLLLGHLKPDSGRFDIGETVRFGYYSQEGLRFNEQMKVIDVVRDIAEEIDVGGGKHLNAAQFLQHFLFTPQTQQNYVYKLSGGEKRRLYLCTVLMKNPNFLVLDEPTNDLDIMTLNVLEEYLRQFKGCVIVVSHDRYFTDKVVDHLLVFKGEGEIKDFPGNYTQYRRWRAEHEEQEKAYRQPMRPTSNGHTHRASVPPVESEAASLPQKRKLSFKEQRELEEVERQIAALEAEKQTLEQGFASWQLSSEALQQASLRMAALLPQLEGLEMRWLELSE